MTIVNIWPPLSFSHNSFINVQLFTNDLCSVAHGLQNDFENSIFLKKISHFN